MSIQQGRLQSVSPTKGTVNSSVQYDVHMGIMSMQIQQWTWANHNPFCQGQLHF